MAAGPEAGARGGPRGRRRGGGGPRPCASERDDLGSQPFFEPASGNWGARGGGRYRRSVLEVAILSLLAESTSHGYDLVDQIQGLASDLVCIDPGSTYRLLRAMEQDGLVTSSWQTPESGPSRRVYVITEQGLEALELMARALEQRAALLQELADHAKKAVSRARERSGQPE